MLYYEGNMYKRKGHLYSCNYNYIFNDLKVFLFKEYDTKEVSFLPISNRIIGIDPGHRGVDPGAVSKTGIKEGDINLKIAGAI